MFEIGLMIACYAAITCVFTNLSSLNFSNEKLLEEESDIEMAHKLNKHHKVFVVITGQMVAVLSAFTFGMSITGMILFLIAIFIVNEYLLISNNVFDEELNYNRLDKLTKTISFVVLCISVVFCVIILV